MNVNILATVRKPELLKMATLVFKSLRVGFPNANVTVYLNNLDRNAESDLLDECGKVQALAKPVKTIHHEWIQGLIGESVDPFFILDTDVIFYSNFERFDLSGCALAGWRIPEWNDSFSGCITRARLHTSLLYIDPVRVRALVKAYESKIADTPFTPKVNLIHPLTLPFKNRPYFYDTCSLLYHSIGGRSFTDEQKESFCHMNFGTIQDIVLPRLSKEEATQIDTARNVILSNNSWGKGSWRYQEDFYSRHPV